MTTTSPSPADGAYARRPPSHGSLVLMLAVSLYLPISLYVLTYTRYQGQFLDSLVRNPDNLSGLAGKLTYQVYELYTPMSHPVSFAVWCIPVLLLAVASGALFYVFWRNRVGPLTAAGVTTGVFLVWCYAGIRFLFGQETVGTWFFLYSISVFLLTAATVSATRLVGEGGRHAASAGASYEARESALLSLIGTHEKYIGLLAATTAGAVGSLIVLPEKLYNRAIVTDVDFRSINVLVWYLTAGVLIGVVTAGIEVAVVISALQGNLRRLRGKPARGRRRNGRGQA